MAVEGRLRNKTLYKLFLIILKYIPVVITLAYILNTSLCWLGIDCPVLSNLAGMSLCTWLFMYIATYVFYFCIYHRLLLYFILANDCISIYDYYFSLPFNDHVMLELYMSLIGILIVSLLVCHVKNNKGDIGKNN